MTTRHRPPHLFCFGLGYSALALSRLLVREGWQVSGTCREEKRQAHLQAEGFNVVRFDRDHPLPAAVAALDGVTNVLSSVPPDAQGDPVLESCRRTLIAHHGLRWVGYLSTTGVYGDTGGIEVDETAPLRPTVERSRRRVAAERQWLDLFRAAAVPVHVFRLAGIYGPNRSPLDQVRRGEAKRLLRPGHLFSRIHVDDLATILRASMARPQPGYVYNVCDDTPAMQSDVVAYACELLGIEPPPLVPFEEAESHLSPMARSFWRDNRRVANTRLKRELGICLRYPDYRAGLRAILDVERQPTLPPFTAPP